jgi:RNA polymerase sigma-B factor
MRELFLHPRSTGDRAARDKLVERFLPLARKLALRYVGAQEPLDDLLQVATVGLIKAIDRYDPDRRTAFSSFAVPTIVGELKRYFRDLGWSAHVPRRMHDAAMQIQSAERRLMSRTGGPPTVRGLAEYLELELDQLIDGLEAAAAHHALSLQMPRDGGGGEQETLGDLLGAEDERFELVDDGLTITAAARQLPERERRVLALRFGRELTQRQIGELISVSQMQVSRLLRRAISQLTELSAFRTQSCEPDCRASTTDRP